MGIRQFFKIKIINEDSNFNGKVISTIGDKVLLKKFKGERISNDASLMIYQSILAMENIQGLTDSDGNTTVHINTIFNKIIQQKQAGIIQIWIFDSPEANPMKIRELEKRKDKRDKSTNEKVLYKLNSTHVSDIQFLLKNLGIMYIIAPPGVEAEQYGAYLSKGPVNERFCKYMLSGDSDVLFFGGNLLRISNEKSATGKTKKTIYQIFELDEVLNELGIDYDKFLEVGVSMGTDWNEKTPGIGCATIMKKLDKLYLTPAMKEAITYYKSDITKLIGKAEIVSGEYNKEKIIEFLVDKKFNLSRVESRLKDFEG